MRNICEDLGYYKQREGHWPKTKNIDLTLSEINCWVHYWLDIAYTERVRLNMVKIINKSQ